VRGYTLRPASCNKLNLTPPAGIAFFNVGSSNVLYYEEDDIQDVTWWLDALKWFPTAFSKHYRFTQKNSKVLTISDPMHHLTTILNDTHKGLNHLVDFASYARFQPDAQYDDVQLLLVHMLLSFRLRSHWEVLGDVSILKHKITDTVVRMVCARDVPPIDATSMTPAIKARLPYISRAWCRLLHLDAEVRSYMTRHDTSYFELYLAMEEGVAYTLQSSLRMWVLERLRSGSFDAPYNTPSDFALPCRFTVMGAPWSMAHTMMLNAILHDGTGLERVRWAEMLVRSGPDLEGAWHLALPVASSVVWWALKLPDVRDAIAPYFAHAVPELASYLKMEVTEMPVKEVAPDAPWLVQVVFKYWKLSLRWRALDDKRGGGEDAVEGGAVAMEAAAASVEAGAEAGAASVEAVVEASVEAGVEAGAAAESADTEAGADAAAGAVDAPRLHKRMRTAQSTAVDPLIHLTPLQRQIIHASTTDDFSALSWLDLHLMKSSFIPPPLNTYPLFKKYAKYPFTSEQLSDELLHRVFEEAPKSAEDVVIPYHRPAGYRGIAIHLATTKMVASSSVVEHKAPEECPVCCEPLEEGRVWVPCPQGDHGACSSCVVRHALAHDNLFLTCLQPGCVGHRGLGLPTTVCRQLLPIVRNMYGCHTREPSPERIQAFADMGGTYPFLTHTSSAGDSDIKQCPGCSRHVMRVIGCLHMTCECGYKFCWSCLGPAHTHFDCLGDREGRKSRSTLMREISAQLVTYVAQVRYNLYEHADVVYEFMDMPIVTEREVKMDHSPRFISYVLTELMPFMEDAQLLRIWQRGVHAIAIYLIN